MEIPKHLPFELPSPPKHLPFELPSPPKHLPFELFSYQLIKTHHIITAEKLFCAVMLVSEIFIETHDINILNVLKSEHPELQKEFLIHGDSLFSILELDELFKNNYILTALDWAKFKFYVEAAKIIISEDNPRSIKNSTNLEDSWMEIKYTGNTKWVKEKTPWKQVKLLINNILRKSSFFILAGQELTDINQHNDYETLKLGLYPKIVEMKQRIFNFLKEKNKLIKYGNPENLITLQDSVLNFLSKILEKRYKKWSKWGNEPHSREETKEYNFFYNELPFTFAIMLYDKKTIYTPQYKSFAKFTYLEKKLNIYFETGYNNLKCYDNEQLETETKKKKEKGKLREEKLDNELLLIESEIDGGKSRKCIKKRIKHRRTRFKRRF